MASEFDDLTLGDKQRLMPILLAKLYIYIYDQGYTATLGDALRDERVFGKPGETKGYGNPFSNHKIKLAQDINLFLNGKWLTKTEDHRKFGEYWESLHPLCSWGGHFDDGNHYSLKHNGRR